MKRIAGLLIAMLLLFTATTAAHAQNFLSAVNLLLGDTIVFSARLDSPENILSGRAGTTVSGVVTVQGNTGAVSFTTDSSVLPAANISVDGQGNVSCLIPEDASANTELPFSVTAVDSNGRKSVIDAAVWVEHEEVVGQGVASASSDTIIGDEWNDVAVEIPASSAAQSTQVTITKSTTAFGEPSISIEPAAPDAITGPVTIYLPDPNVVEASPSAQVPSRLKRRVSRNSSYPVTDYEWASYKDYFLDTWTFKQRIPWAERDARLALNSCAKLSISVASTLTSSVPESHDFSDAIPVLFVHGFTQGGGLGGGPDTWKKLPALIESAALINGKAISFEFSWRTCARFQDVAHDLASAINLIADKTGKKVHIVAHSFGGILVRTLLQGISTAPVPSDSVASVTTLGTPHSGIFDDTIDVEFDDKPIVTFPKGQDSWNFEFAKQVSVYQMGERTNEGQYTAIYDFTKPLPGYIAYRLSRYQDNPLPNGIPFHVRMGAAKYMPVILNEGSSANNNLIQIGPGDGLISYEGQRFHPSLNTDRVLSDNSRVYGGTVSEHILGITGSPVPGDPWPNCDYSSEGYRHTAHWSILVENYVNMWAKAEPAVETKAHASYDAVVEAITMGAQPAEPQTITMGVTVVDSSNRPLSGALVFFKSDHSQFMPVVTDTAGRASKEVSFTPETRYTVAVTKTGYKAEEFDNNFITGTTPDTSSTEFGTVVLQSNVPTTASLTLTVKNARTNGALPGTAWNLTRYSTPIGSGTTNSNGQLSITNIRQGTYSLTLRLDGFRSLTTSVTLEPGTNTLTRELVPSGDTQATAILRWGASPRDLDSHLVKRDSSGNQIYHIFYGHKTDTASGDNLDVDDTSSYGPETVTIQNVDSNARYSYYVYHYSGDGSIASTSQANVRVTMPSGDTRTLHAPTSTSTARYWNVFDIVGGRLQACTSNCLSSSPDAFARSATEARIFRGLPAK